MTKIHSTDVLIIGGGSAGISAAVAAARSGAKVVLVERNSFLGGKASAANVGTICGLYFRNKKGPANYICGGFAKEFAEHLQKECNTSPQSNSEGLHYLPYHPFAFKTVCDFFVKDSRIEVFLHTVITGCDRNKNSITAVHAFAFDTQIIFKATTIIDCSGEAIVSRSADLPIDESEAYQAAAQVFSLHQVDSDTEATVSMILLRDLTRAIQNNEISKALMRTSIVPGSLHQKCVFLKIALPFAITHGLNSVTEIEIQARKLVAELFYFLKNYSAPFKAAQLGEVATEVGIRTGRRPIGKYVLSESDVLSCRKFNTGIANGAWPIEFWEPGKKVKMDYFEENDFYQIPAEALMSNTVTNLFFAGRNISASNAAIASARVIGTCLQTGFAAGKLAAAACQSKSLDHTIESIRMEQMEHA